MPGNVCAAVTLPERLFVYGTLLPGLCRHAAMAGAVRRGSVWIEARLFDLGAYPGIVPGAGRVAGELYEVDEALLSRLDVVEEYTPDVPADSLYLRRRVTVHGLAGGEPLSAWAYIYNRAVDGCVPIVHGDYRRHLRERESRGR